MLCRMLFAAACLVTALSAGCDQPLHRSETALRADGSVDRAIYQKLNETPAAALRPEIWDQFTRAGKISPKDWVGPISSLPILPAGDDSGPYFVAWGHFGS